MTAARRPNRGPKAAAHNRAALIAAAREAFATTGYDASLTDVARAAGVGQGSLYRHFPDRLSLALAVFEDSIGELEALAAEPGTTLEEVLALVTEQAIASTTFVRLVTMPPQPDPRILAIRERLARLLAAGLAEAQRAGRVRGSVTTGDLVLAVGMMALMLAEVPAAERTETAGRIWELLRHGIER
ncbi:TetR/AcrR family transcriptional regulator [Nonomuraea gerenzanensis]|uniref:Transcriptional regulator, TetR family n=1 Tax=Nonomuraea gerenzanensis TaxID=93944 RepID=A0A1M4EFC7_9ACTN|nr:TetR/AcrR family transcriptional regulator [Nonomuraea gerenzanensis]UBU09286.1 TetR/AcrR family transcriptional regulator; helix-turn-helix transcriptional regulator [Nonomuraea gerenzanensis]SBO97691.1 Transcriptional regulator, TetR family [Nonomuraea gerenzanensis]